MGDHLDAQAYTPQEIERCFEAWSGCGGTTPPDGPRFQLRIVGIVRRPLDLGDRGAAGGVLIMTPAFARQTENSIGSYGGMVLRVGTRNGAADVAHVAGLTRRQRVAVSGFQAVPIALGGGLCAVVAAAAASPLFPIGVARRAEPDPGLRIDTTVLAVGTVAIATGILLIAFLAALRTTRRAALRARRPGA